MNVKKVFIVVMSALIMTAALIIGITGNQDGEKEQLFVNQVLGADRSIVQTSLQTGIQTSMQTKTSEGSGKNSFYLSQPNVLVITSLFLLVFFAFSIYLAKQNGLYITSKKKEQKQFEGNNLQKGLQYDQ